jgi:eukaryotic-like serine/threonine-protein kinase
VRLWDVVRHTPAGPPLGGNHGPVAAVAFSQDGHLLATGGCDSTVRLWEVGDRAGSPARPTADRPPWRGDLGGVQPDGRVLAAGVENGRTVL